MFKLRLKIKIFYLFAAIKKMNDQSNFKEELLNTDTSLNILSENVDAFLELVENEKQMNTMQEVVFMEISKEQAKKIKHIEDYNKKIANMKNEYERLFNAKKDKEYELKKQIDELNEVLNDVEIKSLEKKNMDAEKMRNIALSYKLLFGTYFHFNDTRIAGYIRDNRTKELHTFDLDKNSPIEKLYDVFKASSSEDWSDVVDMK